MLNTLFTQSRFVFSVKRGPFSTEPFHNLTPCTTFVLLVNGTFYKRIKCTKLNPMSPGRVFCIFSLEFLSCRGGGLFHYCAPPPPPENAGFALAHTVKFKLKLAYNEHVQAMIYGKDLLSNSVCSLDLRPQP